jgi:hypothetical protein
MILSLLARHAGTTRYVDVGAGDLYFAKRLRALTAAPIYAVDVNYTERASEDQIMVCTDLSQVPSRSIDVALLMDVLEHVADDLALLRAVDRVLAPAGGMLVTVPAHGFLWSDHDVFLGHHRRYTIATLRRLLTSAGLEIVEAFYFYCGPFFARALSVGMTGLGFKRHRSSALSRWSYASGHPITRAVRTTLNWDFRISRLLGAGPLAGCGLSICAICRVRSA